MKEITITLNVSEKGERDLNNFIELIGKDNINKKDLWAERNINERPQELRQNPLTPKDCFEKRQDVLGSGIFPESDRLLKLSPNSPKDEYTLLKEKCIDLECKRLGVDKLQGWQMWCLAISSEFGEIFINPTEKELQNRLDKMKTYIDKVEKVLEDKENVFPIDKIQKRLVELTENKYLKSLYSNDIFMKKIKNLAANEIFDKYKDILTKEQIKELYK